MQRLFGYEARHIPLYAQGVDEVRQRDNLLRQQTLWTAVQELLHGPDGADRSFEIRFTAEPASRRIRLSLNGFRHGAPGAESGVGRHILETIGRVLPADYGWVPLSRSGTAFDSPASALPRGWHVAKLERRLNFIDLPWRSLETMDRSGSAIDVGQAPPPERGTYHPAGPRRIITGPITRGEAMGQRFCLPVSGAIELDDRDLRSLFQEVQREAPCVVSIGVAPVVPQRLDAYRQIATYWADFLEPLSGQIANAGLSRYATLRAIQDRFLLPDRFLVSATIRVAAPTEAAAMAVATHLSARLGGLRAFTIRPPGWHAPAGAERVATATEDLHLLGDPYVDVPHPGWTPRKFDLRRARVTQGLEELGVLPDLEPIFQDFLMELPHFYTIDEIAAVAALPVAGQEGVPGFDARPVAPFSEPNRALQGGGARLRIGLARDEAASGVEGDAWHSIPPSDLTKHALIVGSTGSGKTLTTLFLVRELARLKVPFLIIEPVKTEYYDHLRAIADGVVRRVRLEGTAQDSEAEDFFAFDPMRLQPGVSVARHASYLKSCFEAAFPMPADSVEAMILEAGIRNYYIAAKAQYGCGLSMFTRGGRGAHHVSTVVHFTRRIPADPSGGKPPATRNLSAVEPFTLEAGDELRRRETVVHPSLNGLRTYFTMTFLPSMASASAGAKSAELLAHWRQFFERRFEALSTGMVGMAAAKADRLFLEDPEHYDTFADLIARSSVLELDGIPDAEQKALVMGFIMAFLFERRQADDLLRREAEDRGEQVEPSRSELGIEHVLIVEEAHRVLANIASAGQAGSGGAQGRSVGLFVDMLAEIRAFGQGIVIVEQIPTKIVSEAVKNTNLKIMLRLTSADDREYLGAAMNFTDEQKRFVTSLRAEAGRHVDMVIFEQQLDQPRMLKLPLPDRRETPIHQSLFEEGLENGER